MPSPENPALTAAEASGLPYRVIRHGPAASLAEAARLRDVTPAGVIKTLVVRRADDDYVFVLVPGDRAISWPKLRKLLGVSRLSLPSAEVARQATGYERGTITPFGASTAWPVVADEQVRGHEITLGAGQHGVALAVPADDTLRFLHATVADISEPAPPEPAPSEPCLSPLLHLMSVRDPDGSDSGPGSGRGPLILPARRLPRDPRGQERRRPAPARSSRPARSGTPRVRPRARSGTAGRPGPARPAARPRPVRRWAYGELALGIPCDVCPARGPSPSVVG